VGTVLLPLGAGERIEVRRLRQELDVLTTAGLDGITLLQQRGYANPALDKALAHVGGWADIGTRVRWPYQGVPAAEAEALRPAVRAAVPEFFPETSRP
jgi:hypothetical protein